VLHSTPYLAGTLNNSLGVLFLVPPFFQNHQLKSEMKIKDLPRPLRPFAVFGVEFQPISEHDENASAVCWYCESIVDNEEKTGKFNVHIKTGQFNCLHCGESGNVNVFLKDVIDYHAQSTNLKDYRYLSKLRNEVAPPSEYERAGMVKVDDNEWLVPVHNKRGTVVSIRRLMRENEEEKFVVWALPGTAVFIEGMETYDPTLPSYLVEGTWDRIALRNLFRLCKVRANVLAVPGANIFKKEWADLFYNAEIITLYDNDSAGEEGSAKVFELLQSVASKVAQLVWPSADYAGSDISDYILACRDAEQTPQEILASLGKCLKTPEGKQYKAQQKKLIKPRTKFLQVVNDYNSVYHANQEVEDALAVCCAIILSNQLVGDPLWMFLVGPPGCGKTLMLRGLELSPYSLFRSSITSKSLISGYKTADGVDPSLIPKLRGKTLVLKDFTEIMTMNKEEQEAIYSILRGAFDGQCQKEFGNGTIREYLNCHFSLLAGVTDEIHARSDANLGERFLKYQLVTNTINSPYDMNKHIKSALANISQQREKDDLIKNSVASFTDRTIDHASIPEPTTAILNKIIPLSILVGLLRTSIPKSWKGELTNRPAPEVGSRLAKQLLKLGNCLSIVFGGKGEITSRVYKILEKVAFDTITGFRTEVFIEIARKPCTRQEIQENLQLPMSSLRRQLDELKLLGLITESTRNSRSKGQPAKLYRLSENTAASYKAAKITLHRS
jgi:hypothetical protein